MPICSGRWFSWMKLSSTPRGFGFDFCPGHKPRLQVWSLIRVNTEATISFSFPLTFSNQYTSSGKDKNFFFKSCYPLLQFFRKFTGLWILKVWPPWALTVFVSLELASWDEANMPCVSSPATNPSPGLWGWKCSAKKLMDFGARLSSQGLIRADAWGKLVHSADQQLQNESLVPHSGPSFYWSGVLEKFEATLWKVPENGSFLKPP